MAYTKTQWVNNTTPINDTNLNKIEQGIYDNSLVVDAVTNTLNPTDTETYKTAELTEGQITDVIGVNDILIKGQTSQDGEPTPSSPVDVNVVSGSNVINTSNKNSLDISAMTTQVIAGVSVTNNRDGTLTLNGTSNSSGGSQDISIEIPLKKNVTYTLSQGTNTVGAAYSLSLRDVSNLPILSLDSGTRATLVTPSSDIVAKYFRLYFAPNKIFTNLTIYPMFEKGSTETTHIAHQGKELTLDLPVENLFNYNSWLENKQNWETSRYSINKDYIISTMPTANDWASLTPPMNATPSTADIEKLTWMSFPVKPNTEYTMRLKNNNKCLMQTLWFFYNENYGYIQTGNINATDTEYVIFKFTTTNATKFVSFRFDNESYSSIAKQLIISEIQFEEGSKANAYTPYGTEPIELCKIGNYQDYFYKSESKWYLHKEIGSFILNGNVSFQKYSSSNSYYTTISSFTNNVPVCPETNNIVAPIICTHFDTTYINDIAYNSVQKIGFTYINTKEVWFGLPTSIATNVSEVQNWLNNQINNGNAVVVRYALATPTDTEITDTTLISQLEAIYNAPLYEETNITQENNDLPMVLDITACKDNINGIKAFIRK